MNSPHTHGMWYNGKHKQRQTKRIGYDSQHMLRRMATLRT